MTQIHSGSPRVRHHSTISAPPAPMTSDGQLRISQHDVGPVRILRAVGTADAMQPTRLIAALSAALADPPPGGIVVDMAAVEFIGSAGLSALVDFHSAAGSAGVVWALVASRAVTRPLRALGFADIEVCASTTEACDHCRARVVPA